MTKEMNTLKDQAKTLQVEINDMKEQKTKGTGDAAITSTIKTEHIKNLEEQLMIVDKKAEKLVT